MRAALLLTLASVATALRVPPPRCCAAAAASTKQLYSQIDSALRRARSKAGSSGNGLAASTAKSLGNRWMDLAPAELVEATLVSGGLILDSFDEGLAILQEAEDGAALNISGKAYSALMRLAQAEERHVEALSLLARTRAYAVERTDGLLLSAMRAAAELEDWGAVARLYAELAEGEMAAAALAMELETYADAAVLAELRGSSEVTEAEAAELELAQALSLALQAHCERGDVPRVIRLLERKRKRGAAVESDEYSRLWKLALRSKSAAPLAALTPLDLRRSLDRIVEPRVFAVRNKVGLVAANLGSVERIIALAIAAGAVVAAAVVVTGGLGGSDDAATAALDALQPIGSIDSLTSGSVPGLY